VFFVGRGVVGVHRGGEGDQKKKEHFHGQAKGPSHKRKDLGLAKLQGTRGREVSKGIAGHPVGARGKVGPGRSRVRQDGKNAEEKQSF